MASGTKTRPQSSVAHGQAGGEAEERAPLVRGEAIVQRVLDAALLELSERGYHGFRMEEVAARAQVNKTTVYRRWPTRQELVRDALTREGSARPRVRSTGSLRGDLLLLARTYVGMASQPIGRSVVRMLMAESSDPEVVALVRALRDSTMNAPRELIAAAVERGELARGRGHEALLDALAGAMQHRLFFLHEEADEAFLRSLVDLLLYGALGPGAAPKRAHQ